MNLVEQAIRLIESLGPFPEGVDITLILRQRKDGTTGWASTLSPDKAKIVMQVIVDTPTVEIEETRH
jgi:hypothetical protein